MRPSVPESEWNVKHELSFQYNYSYICEKCSALEKKIFDVQAENTLLKDQLREEKKQRSKIQHQYDDILKPNPLMPKE